MQRFKQVLSVAGSLVLLSLPVIAWTQRQAITDYVRLRNYTPSAEIAKIADRASFNDDGKKLFYVNHPLLLDRNQFNENCTSVEQSIVLGCYVEQQGIYLFDVEEERLDGVEEVTAAHEMLHVAYERLSSADKAMVDDLTQQAFKSLTNERIIGVVESYRDRDPSIVSNELHSIIGTEVRQIPIELEQYYRRYFVDRKAVVTLAEKYEKAFTEREDKIKEYDRKLSSLKAQIDTLQADLSSQASSISSERARLDALYASNDVEAYNSAVPGFNAQVQAHNATVQRLQSLIDQHNALVAQRNELVVEEQELVQAIDSRPQTINSQ